MENFLVSARKYRPATFDAVVGQSHITDALQNAVKNNTLAQSFLFCGPRGVGKTTCARILARYINETETSIEAPNNFNIYELDAASNNSVEDIRNLIDQVRYAPQEGKYKVYIIDEVHMLSQNAFNAFLKTLEEPPSYAIFILATTEKHKIIPTILSRCQIFDFKRIQVEDMAAYLAQIAKKENIGFEPDALHIIAQKADGALRDALSIFDRISSFSENNITLKNTLEILNILDYDYYFKLTDAFLSEDVALVLNIYNDIINNGFEGDNFITGLAGHFRNLLVAQDHKTLQLLEVGENIKERYLHQSILTPRSFILNAINLLNQCDINYKMSKNKRLHLELYLIKICYINSRLTENYAPQTIEPIKKKSDSNLIASATSTAPIVESKVNGHADSAELINKNVSEPVSSIAKTEVKEAKLSSSSGKSVPAADSNPTSPSTSFASQEIKNTSKIKSLGSVAHIIKEEERKANEAEKIAIIDVPQEKLDIAWKAYIDILEKKEKMSLYAAFENLHPTVLEKNIIEVIAYNQLQVDQLDMERTEIVSIITNHLNIPKIDFLIKLEKREVPLSEKKLYTASDKFKHMANKNPHLYELKKRLDLNLEY